jgi:hypothetical protein
MAKSTGSKGTGDDAAEVFEVRGNKCGVTRLARLAQRRKPYDYFKSRRLNN